MSYAVLEKEIESLSQAAISEVVDFVRLLKLKFPEDSVLSEKKSMYGVWKNDHFICLLILTLHSMILRNTCNEVPAGYSYNSLVSFWRFTPLKQCETAD